MSNEKELAEPDLKQGERLCKQRKSYLQPHLFEARQRQLVYLLVKLVASLDSKLLNPFCLGTRLLLADCICN